MDRSILAIDVNNFRKHLEKEERSQGTVENYLRGVRMFSAWLGGNSVQEDSAANWKHTLLEQGYRPRTINAMLAAIHSFFSFMRWRDCDTKTLKIQRQVFREDKRELTREEYQQLLRTANTEGKDRLALVMEAICATGIRVSEVKYLTVEAACQGRTDISMKGKIRTILIPKKLSKKLLRYARENKITSGEIFLTRDGKSLSRKQIWAEMKRICKVAGVDAEKVFPHNLRHLFARCFYQITRDIVKLADVLGHSSIDTTRIYLVSTGTEHAKHLNRLGLIS